MPLAVGICLRTMVPVSMSTTQCGTRCRHVRRMPHDGGRSARCGRAAVLHRLLAKWDVDKLKTPGKALYSCMLGAGWRRHRRSYRLFLTRRLVPAWSLMRRPPTGSGMDRGAGERFRRAGRASLRPRHDRGPGTAGADQAEKLLPQALRAPAMALKPFQPPMPVIGLSVAPATPVRMVSS